LSFGCYIFARPDSPIIFGDYNIVAPNVVVAGYSHDLYDYTKFPSKGGIRIGDYCWLAANSSIMPGVVLGDHVIVAANSVVTKSFKQGYCVVAGNPAKVVKELDPDKVVKNRNPYEYHGFIRKDNFESFSSKYLDVSKCVV
jgi:acetyltransferase-like isoleucine patch superfamily enzyme